MNRKERDELGAIYGTLVMAEHEAGKTEAFLADSRETVDYARGYQDGVGKALDLLGAFMNMEVR